MVNTRTGKHNAEKHSPIKKQRKAVKKIQVPTTGSNSKVRSPSIRVRVSKNNRDPEEISKAIKRKLLSSSHSKISPLPDSVSASSHTDSPSAARLLDVGQVKSSALVSYKRGDKVFSPVVLGQPSQRVEKKESMPAAKRRCTRRSSSKNPTNSSSSQYDHSHAHSEKFFTAQNQVNWKYMSQRLLLGERTLSMKSFLPTGIVELLKERNLLGTVTKPKPYVSNIVYEFYTNLSSEIMDVKSPKYMKVYVHGKVFDFSAQVINSFLGSTDQVTGRSSELDPEPDLDVVATELIGTTSVWPKSNTLLSANLTTKYSLLLRIALANWYPSLHTTSINPEMASILFRVGKGHPLDIGKLIFAKIFIEIDSEVTCKVLGFPSLIYQILMSQHDIRLPGDVLTKLSKPLKVSDKLLQGNRVVDIQGELTAAAGTKEAHGVSSPSISSSSLDNRVQWLVSEVNKLHDSHHRMFANFEEVTAAQKRLVSVLTSLASKIEGVAAGLDTLLAPSGSARASDTAFGFF